MKTGRSALVVAIALLMGAFGYLVMMNLSRVLRTPEPAEEAPSVETAPAPAPGANAAPRIRAKLFFTAENGFGLTAVEREVSLGAGIVGQARALVEAQLAEPAPAPLVSAVPAGTKVRGLFLSATNELFVDLDGTIQKAHPGGSLNELLTVYTIVNAITVNLPDIEQVQLLVDGREVDTLAGHIDLRRPLRKHEGLLQP